MSTQPYWLSFGASAVSGLSPTFIQFRTTAGVTQAPPAITEPGSFGMYLFNYAASTQIAFICDGATSGLAFQDRYIKGVLDPFDLMGYTLQSIGASASVLAVGASLTALAASFQAFGTSAFAQGQTAAAILGNSSSSYGTNSADPTSVYGFLKRALETREGNETYVKATGVLDIYSRGSSQLLAEKTIADSTTSTTKT